MGYLSDLKLPLLGETMETGRIAEWCVKPGDEYARGQVLLEVETDKTIVEVPALQQGKLIKIVAEAGAQAAVGAVIAQVELQGSPPATATDRVGSSSINAEATVSVLPAKTTSTTSQAPYRTTQKFSSSVQQGQRVFVTPRARRTAKHHGIDVNSVERTGRRQRVTYKDVIKTVADQSVGTALYNLSTDVIVTPVGKIHRTHWVPQGLSATTTVVMVHGLFGDAQVWTELVKLLIDNQRTQTGTAIAFCAVDLPGHGSSTSGASSHEQVCQAITHVVQGFDQIVLVGHSYGGAIATSVATKLAAKIKALLLVAPVGLGSEIDQQFLDAMVSPDSDETQLQEALAKLTASGETPAIEYIQLLGKRLKLNSLQLQALVNEIACKGAQQIDIRHELSALICPVAIAWGREDKIIDSRDSLSAPANSDVTLLANSGHMPHVEQAGQIARLVDALL